MEYGVRVVEMLKRQHFWSMVVLNVKVSKLDFASVFS